MKVLPVLFLIMLAPGFAPAQPTAPLMLGQGIMAGEVTENGVILHARLTAGDTLIDRELPGKAGRARFLISKDQTLEPALRTPWQQAVPELDHIVKATIDGLEPGTRYFWSVEFGPATGRTQLSRVGTFRTHSGRAYADTVRFAVVTGMNWHKFHLGTNTPGGSAIYGGKYFYTGPDKHLGFPALQSIMDYAPHYFVATGDNVYYDGPRSDAAETAEQIRRKYHEQFVQLRYRDMFLRLGTYWEKDDHDYRYNDSDTSGTRQPSHALGIRMFREQLPVVDLSDDSAVTYRTWRVSKDLQVWFTENRDYRSPNDMTDGPAKTIWGDTQKAWLQQTLLDSDATFKVLISPTPLVGPDDAYKKDNHTNHEGFRHEGDAFFVWLKKHNFNRKGFVIVCGDRHWQYHSIHPSGIHEFSTGALVDNNAREGRAPGDPESTDPQAGIQQPYLQHPPSGGFLVFEVLGESPATRTRPRMVFNFCNELGNLLYSYTKTGRR